MKGNSSEDERNFSHFTSGRGVTRGDDIPWENYILQRKRQVPTQVREIPDKYRPAKKEPGRESG
jgi:hypothetical protein